MTVIPFPSHRRHWRQREPLSVRAALAIVGGFCLLVWGLFGLALSLVIG